MQLENKCKIFERKFTAALRYQYKVLAEYWNLFSGLGLDYKDLSFKFVRNVPKDIQGEAQALALLKGNVSDKTALSQMSFIDSADEEIKQMESEREVYPDLEEVDEAITSAEADRQTDNSTGTVDNEPVPNSTERDAI
jgi:hypothetical protein